MTAAELAALRKAAHRYELAAMKAESARVDRDALIREALTDGFPQTRVAEETGLTRGRIGQLAQTPPRKGTP